MLLLLSLVSLFTIINGQIECRTTSWWVLQPFSKSFLQPFLDKANQQLTFNTSNPLASFMKPDEHPVYFEFNKQNNCQQTSLPPWLANATEQTFEEFKLELPYLIRQNKPVMLKPLVYQNNIIDVEASRLVYGLPTYDATMQADFNHNTYSISYKPGLVKVSFEPLTPSLVLYGSSPDTANFSSFVDANVSPWLAFPPTATGSRTKCASNLYNFTQTALVRPVKMTLQVVNNIFGSLPAGTYTNAGNQPLGAWQIDVHLKITSTYECP